MILIWIEEVINLNNIFLYGVVFPELDPGISSVHQCNIDNISIWSFL